MMESATDPQMAAKVLRYYELVDLGDLVALIDLFASDAIYYRPGYEPLIGRENLARFYHDRRVIREGQHTVHTLVSNGSQVAVHGGFKGTLRDGRLVSVRFGDFFEIDADRRFCRRDTFFFTPFV